jgi:acylaminoacyl-peptidase
LESLPGNIGENDVLDCKAALDVVLQSGTVRTDQIFIMGGSHGGFLLCHLIARYPKLFSAAAARNPVVNVWANYLTCDIPDWCLSEAGTGVKIGPVADKGGAETMPSPGNEEHALQMFRASPVASIDQVECPLLLLLGSKDKRVPLGQSIQYYYGLKSKGVECKMNIYDMSHSLSDNVQQKANVWVSVTKWFLRHVGNK